MTKPGYFNWSLLYGDKDAKEGTDSNYTEEVDDGEPTVDDPDGENDEDVGSTAAPLTATDLDVEDPDDVDDDEGGNTIRVGEDYGMD